VETVDYSQPTTKAPSTPFKPYQPALTFFSSGEERGKEEQQEQEQSNKQLNIPTSSNRYNDNNSY
jgi:hypothetical protein